MLGLSVKLWRTEFNPKKNEFESHDSVVYIFQERDREDLAQLATTVTQLVGDDSLDVTFQTLFPEIPETTEKLTEKPNITKHVKDNFEMLTETKESLDPIIDDYGVKEEVEYSDAEEDIKNSDFKLELEESEDEEDEKPKKNASQPQPRKRTPSEISEMTENCGLCGKGFIARSKLLIHIKSCNPGQIATLGPKPKKKRMISDDMKRQGVQKRKETLAQNLVIETCTKCEREYQRRAKFLMHLQLCNPSQIENLPDIPMSQKAMQRAEQILNKTEAVLACTFCSRPFLTKGRLENHEELHRTEPNHPSLRGGRGVSTPLRKKSVPLGDYRCERCSCKFIMMVHLERHLEAHNLYDSLTDGKKEEEEGAGLVVIENEDGVPVKCCKCKLAFTSEALHNNHMHRIHGKTFQCESPGCDKVFVLPNALKNHRLNHHTTFPRACDDCGKYYKTKEEFKAHLISVHGSVTTKSNSVSCEVCGKTIKNKYSLLTHMKIAHAGPERKLYPCEECGKVLKSKQSLTYHLKVHSGDYSFTCDTCGRGFMSFKKMMNCKSQHAGIYKYRCSHCDFKTNDMKCLSNHVSIHSDEKPLSCPLCNHSSRNESNLGNHIRKVHKLTLCQAEVAGRRSRHGHLLSEAQVEATKLKVLEGIKTAESSRMRRESQMEFN